MLGVFLIMSYKQCLEHVQKIVKTCESFQKIQPQRVGDCIVQISKKKMYGICQKKIK